MLTSNEPLNNNDKRIIAFCGRKESGKTELAKICEEFGFKRLSFASALKQLISKLIQCDLNEINKLKNVETEYKFTDNHYQIIANETNIPLSIVTEKMSSVQFKTVRQLLQFIGTDLIRVYCPNWHIEKMREEINEVDKYVIDDVRFPNEVELIKELDGDLWFVVRPKLDNISNHESENSLRWQDFDNVIVNDKTLTYLQDNWRIFMENDYNMSKNKRRKFIEDITGNKDKIKQLDNNAFNIFDNLFISKYEFEYDAKFFNIKDNVINVKFNNDYAMVYLNNKTIDVIKNPLMLEDLKLYIK